MLTNLNQIVRDITHGNFMYLFRDHSASTSLGNGEGVDEKCNKKWCRKEDSSQKSDVPHTSYSMHFFL